MVLNHLGAGVKRMYGGMSFFGTVNMPVSAHIRFLNVIRGLQEVSLYIDGQQYFSDVPFGLFTDYVCSPPGIYNLALNRAGDYGSPVLQSTETFSVGSSITLAATSERSYIKIYQIPEPYSARETGLRTALRLVNLSTEEKVLDGWLHTGAKIFSGVRYTELSPYVRLQPNFYTLTITDADTGETIAVAENLNLQLGKIHSVYVVMANTENNTFITLFTTDSEISDITAPGT